MIILKLFINGCYGIPGQTVHDARLLREGVGDKHHYILHPFLWFLRNHFICQIDPVETLCEPAKQCQIYNQPTNVHVHIEK